MTAVAAAFAAAVRWVESECTARAAAAHREAAADAYVRGNR